MQTDLHTVNLVSLGFSGVCEFIHNGKKRHLFGSNLNHADPGKLRAQAAREMERANEAVRRAALNIAVAEAKEAEMVVREAEAKKQRNERAAATRAHNKDPFGFGTILGE